MSSRWWEKYNPSRLDYECEKLREAGIKYSIDEDAFAKGVVRLVLPETEAGKVFVIFPDLYPYFRFEIIAPEINLKYHQDPFGKSLCLLGRATDNWDPKFTVAELIAKQLPKVLQASQITNREEADTLEEHQAEPVSDYYAPMCARGVSAIVDSTWNIDEKYESGNLILGTNSPDKPLCQWAVLEIQDEDGNTLAKSSDYIKKMFSGGPLVARWVRLHESPIFQNLDNFFKHLEGKDMYPKKLESYKVKQEDIGGRLTIRAVLSPEETHQWRQTDQGWLFICNVKVVKSYVQKK